MRCTCSHIRDSHATVPEKSFCLIGGCPCQAWEVEEDELTPLQKIDHVISINYWDLPADTLQIAQALRRIALLEKHDQDDMGDYLESYERNRAQGFNSALDIIKMILEEELT